MAQEQGADLSALAFAKVVANAFFPIIKSKLRRMILSRHFAAGANESLSIKVGDLSDLSFSLLDVTSVASEPKLLLPELERSATANGSFLQPLAKWSAETVAQYLLTLDRVVIDPIGIESLHSEQLKACCATIRGENVTGVVLKGMSQKDLETLGLHRPGWDINYAERLYNNKERLLGHEVDLTQDEESNFKLNELNLFEIFSDAAVEYRDQRFTLTMDDKWDNLLIADWITHLGARKDDVFEEVAKRVVSFKTQARDQEDVGLEMDGNIFRRMVAKTRQLLKDGVDVNSLKFDKDEQRPRILYDLIPARGKSEASLARRDAYARQIMEAVERHEKEHQDSNLKINIEKFVSKDEEDQKSDVQDEDTYQAAVFGLQFELSTAKEITIGLDGNEKVFETIKGFVLVGDVKVEFDALESLFSVTFNKTPTVTDAMNKEIVFKVDKKQVNVSKGVADALAQVDSVTFGSH